MAFPKVLIIYVPLLSVLTLCMEFLSSTCSPPPTSPGSWAAAGTSEKRETVFPLQVSFRFTPNISVDNFQDVLKAFASTDQEFEIKVEPLSETQ